MIPVSVIITTRNEEGNIARCLNALSNFDEVIVVDSNSNDRTCMIASDLGARIESFSWNGSYPKKRQWSLDHIETRHNMIFFVDADEVLTSRLVDEIKSVTDTSCAGYFVKGRYIWNGRALKHGLQNNKLVLFNRYKVEFPVVDDLDIAGMGEMEGHYQPVLKKKFAGEVLGQLVEPLLHYADNDNWHKRLKRYAHWEAEMIKRHAYPRDPSAVREFLKQMFRSMPFRPLIAFAHSYILKRGFLGGRAGFEFAKSRYTYYRMVSNALKNSRESSSKADLKAAE